MSDSIKSADRRLKLLLMLQSSKQLSVNKIADYFGVSRRTVFRDLRALQDLEVPIIHDSVEGYSLIKGYKVPPLMFTERELSSIVLGLSFMKSQIDETMNKDALQVLLKIKNAVPSKLLDFIHSIENNVIASPYYTPKKQESTESDWFLLLNAISENSRIQFDYTNQLGETGKRIIDPYLIVLYQDHWNVIGFDHNRKGRRNFRLDSIQHILLLPERFTSLSESEKHQLLFSFDTQTANQYQIQVNNDKKDTFLKIFPGYIVSKTETPTTILITFTFDSVSFLAEFLLPHLPYIQIDSSELKLAVKEELQKRLALL